MKNLRSGAAVGTMMMPSTARASLAATAAASRTTATATCCTLRCCHRCRRDLGDNGIHQRAVRQCRYQWLWIVNFEGFYNNFRFLLML